MDCLFVSYNAAYSMTPSVSHLSLMRYECVCLLGMSFYISKSVRYNNRKIFNIDTHLVYIA